jgi:hypothetical protein
MQCLASLAVGLHLDQLLCQPPVAPHLRHCATPESGTAVWCASDWAWLDCFSTTVKAAEALARGATFPESFSVPDMEPVPRDEMALLMVSVYLYQYLDGILDGVFIFSSAKICSQSLNNEYHNFLLCRGYLMLNKKYTFFIQTSY